MVKTSKQKQHINSETHSLPDKGQRVWERCSPNPHINKRACFHLLRLFLSDTHDVEKYVHFPLCMEHRSLVHKNTYAQVQERIKGQRCPFLECENILVFFKLSLCVKHERFNSKAADYKVNEYSTKVHVSRDGD